MISSLLPKFQPKGGVSDKVLKNYCWMYSTFNIPANFEGNCARSTHDPSPSYNSYYQWVPIFLMLQAIMFYVPRIIWLMMEGGEMLELKLECDIWLCRKL